MLSLLFIKVSPIKTASTSFSFNLVTSSFVLIPLSETNITSPLTHLRRLILFSIFTVKL